MPPALRIESLWKCYAAGVRGCSARVWVLRGLSLTIEAGEHVAIVAAAGAGKTTLAKCILGRCAPTAGLIEISGSLDIVDLQEVRATGCHEVANPGACCRHSGRPAATLVLATRPDALATWADRLLHLRDGRLHASSFRPARRVAEGVALVRSGKGALR